MEKKQYEEPMTIEEQIINLKNIGLSIDDEDEARAFLNDVSYFRLIKAFSLGLKKKNDRYNENVTFGEIKKLYLYNCKFRQALFAQIERAEINLRCRLSNYFSCKYGNFGYEQPENFNDPKYHNLFIDDINAEIERNKKAPFVRNFQANYETGRLPFYAVIELFSFGTLSKFFKTGRVYLKLIRHKNNNRKLKKVVCKTKILQALFLWSLFQMLFKNEVDVLRKRAVAFFG